MSVCLYVCMSVTERIRTYLWVSTQPCAKKVAMITKQTLWTLFAAAALVRIVRIDCVQFFSGFFWTVEKGSNDIFSENFFFIGSIYRIDRPIMFNICFMVTDFLFQRTFQLKSQNSMPFHSRSNIYNPSSPPCIFLLYIIFRTAHSA